MKSHIYLNKLNHYYSHICSPVQLQDFALIEDLGFTCFEQMTIGIAILPYDINHLKFSEKYNGQIKEVEWGTGSLSKKD